MYNVIHIYYYIIRNNIRQTSRKYHKTQYQKISNLEKKGNIIDVIINYHPISHCHPYS